jgi:hypothetical protein
MLKIHNHFWIKARQAVEAAIHMMLYIGISSRSTAFKSWYNEIHVKRIFGSGEAGIETAAEDFIRVAIVRGHNNQSSDRLE